jgi:hypothetical protein
MKAINNELFFYFPGVCLKKFKETGRMFFHMKEVDDDWKREDYSVIITFWTHLIAIKIHSPKSMFSWLFNNSRQSTDSLFPFSSARRFRSQVVKNSGDTRKTLDLLCHFLENL